MKVGNKNMQGVWMEYANENVFIIDQRKLPHELKIVQLKTLKDLHFSIQDMWIRGAPLIGAVAAYGVYLAVKEINNSKNFKTELQEKMDYLKTSRPTAYDLFFAIDYMKKGLDKFSDSKKDRVKFVKNLADKYTALVIDKCKNIGINGYQIIKALADKKKGPVNILTHCNAGWLATVDYGTATAPIYEAFNKGIEIHVWVDETRPRLQGARLTAWELGQHGVPHTIIADNTGGLLMWQNKVDMVIVGSDRTTRNGDVANKIGTYEKALVAKDNGVPFYVALPKSTFDFDLNDGKDIPIEERDAFEVKNVYGLVDNELKSVSITPPNSPALNYAFDITPARLVTGLITENGICKANEDDIVRIMNYELKIKN